MFLRIEPDDASRQSPRTPTWLHALHPGLYLSTQAAPALHDILRESGHSLVDKPRFSEEKNGPANVVPAKKSRSCCDASSFTDFESGRNNSYDCVEIRRLGLN